jgi:ABC-type transport system involved in multi-copper enzyme maturation permease subunit
VRPSSIREIENPLLSLFPAPDPTHLVKFAMSLLSLFLAYDAICGERQRGTLKLLFAEKQ